MSSQDTEKIKSGGKLILFGVIGIIIMVSAKFLSLTLVEDVIVGSQFVGLSIAENFYELLMMPLINVAMFLVVGILFFVLFFQAFQFLTGQDDGAKKKAAGMILRSVVGILVILSSNQLVESVFGSRERVFQGASNVGEVGMAIFENSSIPMLYEIINRIMGFAALVVLILIMFQTFMMLTKPDDPNMTKKIKNTLLYVAIGVVVIGAGYLITNVLLIN